MASDPLLIDKIRSMLDEARRLFNEGKEYAASEHAVRAFQLMDELELQEVRSIVKAKSDMKFVQDCNLTRHPQIMWAYAQVKKYVASNPSQKLGPPDLGWTGTPPEDVYADDDFRREVWEKVLEERRKAKYLLRTPVKGEPPPLPSELIRFCARVHRQDPVPATRFFVATSAFGLCAECCTKPGFKADREISLEEALEICYIEDVMST